LRILKLEREPKAKTPRLPLEILNVCDEILNNESTINNQTERWFRSFTADQPEVQTAGKSLRPILIRSQLNRQEFLKEMFDLN